MIWKLDLVWNGMATQLFRSRLSVSSTLSRRRVLLEASGSGEGYWTFCRLACSVHMEFLRIILVLSSSCWYYIDVSCGTGKIQMYFDISVFHPFSLFLFFLRRLAGSVREMILGVGSPFFGFSAAVPRGWQFLFSESISRSWGWQ